MAPPNACLALCKKVMHNVCHSLATILNFGRTTIPHRFNLNHLCSFSVPFANACCLQNHVSNSTRKWDIQTSLFEPDQLWFNHLWRWGARDFFHFVSVNMQWEILRRYSLRGDCIKV